MQLVADGIMLGLALAILVGPIFVALMQTGIHQGIKAGITVGLGIWISDLLVILASYFFISQLRGLTESVRFNFWMGAVGGLVLIGSGLVSIIKNKPEMGKMIGFSTKSFMGYFAKGFAVNFINPFTFVFWIGLMSTYVLGRGVTGIKSVIFFGSILCTIMVTDSLKVILSNAIRSKMSLNHMRVFNRLAGLMLILFGIVLMIRVGIV
jgi:threonine/homoserine/homoserine lactone efflux protein